MEESIAAQLKLSVPQPDLPPDLPPVEVNTEEASSIEYDTEFLDELSRYKLAQHFGMALRPSDSQSTNQLNFVYQRVAETIGNTEYGYVADAISRLERILGVSQSDQRLFRVYKWLKLDKIRQDTEAEMRSYVG